MLSQTCKAAIKAVFFLASNCIDEEKSSIKRISGEINESEHTVGKLLQTLVKKKVINSTKGPAGGFYITKKQLSQPIMKVVKAIDGNGIFTECGLGLSRCSEKHPCPIHNQFKASRDSLKQLFMNNRIGNVSSSITQGHTFLND